MNWTPGWRLPNLLKLTSINGSMTLLTWPPAAPAAETRVVKVGIYANPPKIYTNTEGQAAMDFYGNHLT